MVRIDVFGQKGISKDSLLGLISVIEREYDTKSDLNPFYLILNKSKVFRHSFLKWIGTHPTCGYSLYELLVICLCLQNTNIKRTIQMMNNLFTTFGVLIKFDGKRLYGFWNPILLNDQELKLRELKLGYRAKLLVKLSLFFSSQDHQYEKGLWRLSDSDLIRSLQEIPSVGPATASYLAFEYFHKYDASYHIPPWERKIFSYIFKMKGIRSKNIIEFAKKTWPHYSMLALHVLFEDQFWKMHNGKNEWLKNIIRT